MIYDDNGDDFGELFDRFEGEIEEIPEADDKPEAVKQKKAPVKRKAPVKAKRKVAPKKTIPKKAVAEKESPSVPALTPKVRRSMSGKLRQNRVFKQMEADAKEKRGEELLKAYKETHKPGRLIAHPTLPNTWIEEKIKK
jgi:hypothetical protein